VKIKLLLVMALLGALTTFMLFGWTSAAAQTPTNTNPGGAIYLDNQWHVIPANTTLWYVFDYNGDGSSVELNMADGYIKKLQFNLYTPDQISPSNVGTPIGRGSSPLLNCDSGKCQADYLLWRGVFTGPGTFYIEIVNTNAIAQPFIMGIAGSGITLRIPVTTPTLSVPTPAASSTRAQTVTQLALIPAIATLRAPVTATVLVTNPVVAAAPTTALVTSPVVAAVPTTVSTSIAIAPTPGPTLLCAPAGMPTCTASTVVVAVPSPIPSAVPTAVPPPAFTPTPVNSWWSSSAWVLDSQPRAIPANSDRWFVFNYAGDRSKIEIRIPGGSDAKLAFRLFTTDQAQRYVEDGKAIGDGNAAIVPCDTGRCTSSDLTWAGDFMVSGPYFIQVSNRNSAPKTFQLMVTGSGVTLSQ
jgi:hypothetical protein